MRSLGVLVLLCLFALSVEAAPNKIGVILPAALGVSAEACSGPSSTVVFTMDGGAEHYDQVTFKILPAALGTSTYVQIACTHSETTTGLVPIYTCDNTSPIAVCIKDVRQFPLTAEGVSSTWRSAYSYMQCTFTCDGNGTINATAQRVAD